LISLLSSLDYQPNHSCSINLGHNPFFVHCYEYESRCQNDTYFSILKLLSVWGKSKTSVEVIVIFNPFNLRCWSHLILTYTITGTLIAIIQSIQ
jgi:hypothetical protein